MSITRLSLFKGSSRNWYVLCEEDECLCWKSTETCDILLGAARGPVMTV
jgi:hypothetical protein